MSQKDSETLHSAYGDELPTAKLHSLKFAKQCHELVPKTRKSFHSNHSRLVVGGSHSISALASSDSWQRWTVLSSLLGFLTLSWALSR